MWSKGKLCSSPQCLRCRKSWSEHGCRTSRATPRPGSTSRRSSTPSVWKLLLPGLLFPANPPQNASHQVGEWPQVCFEFPPLVFSVDTQLSAELHAIHSRLLNGATSGRWKNREGGMQAEPERWKSGAGSGLKAKISSLQCREKWRRRSGAWRSAERSVGRSCGTASEPWVRAWLWGEAVKSHRSQHKSVLVQSGSPEDS